jgi:hypothetical protein
MFKGEFFRNPSSSQTWGDEGGGKSIDSNVYHTVLCVDYTMIDLPAFDLLYASAVPSNFDSSKCRNALSVCLG